MQVSLRGCMCSIQTLYHAISRSSEVPEPWAAHVSEVPEPWAAHVSEVPEPWAAHVMHAMPMSVVVPL